MLIWFEVISDLFINIAAGWFGAVFIEFRISKIDSPVEISALMIKFGLGIMSLSIAKYLRYKSKRR